MDASRVNGQAMGSGSSGGQAQLQRTSSQRRSLYRDSFGVHTPEYAADCGSIEESDPSSPIQRVSVARTNSRRSGSLGRSASLSSDRLGSGSFKRSVGRS